LSPVDHRLFDHRQGDHSHRRYDTLSPRRLQELGRPLSGGGGILYRSASDEGVGMRDGLSECQSNSVVDVLGAEVRPGSQREHGEIAELNDEPAGHISPQDRVTEQVNECEPVASRQERM
jgi:hypothetical protein